MNSVETPDFGFPMADDTQPYGMPENIVMSYVNGTDSLGLPDTRMDPDDIEAAWDEEIDHEAEDKEYKTTQPPGGYYDVATLEGSPNTKEAKFYTKRDDGTYALVTEARLKVRYSGKGSREVEDLTYTPYVKFTLSPKPAYKADFETKQLVVPPVFDSAHKLYHRAKLVYEQVMGQKCRTFRDLHEFLSTHSIKARTMQSSDGLIVLDLVAGN